MEFVDAAPAPEPSLSLVEQLLEIVELQADDQSATSHQSCRLSLTAAANAQSRLPGCSGQPQPCPVPKTGDATKQLELRADGDLGVRDGGLRSQVRVWKFGTVECDRRNLSRPR